MTESRYKETPLPDTNHTPPVNQEWQAEIDRRLKKLLEDNKTLRLGDPSYGFINWQVGPLANGRNGALLEEVVEALIERMELFQAVAPCRENAIILTHFEEALLWIRRRVELRQTQGVTGLLEPHSSHGQGLYTAPQRWGFEYPQFADNPEARAEAPAEEPGQLEEEPREVNADGA